MSRFSILVLAVTKGKDFTAKELKTKSYQVKWMLNKKHLLNSLIFQVSCHKGLIVFNIYSF